ncbi:hypothetical protein [Nocardia sp. AB354]|uniref:hypothetical protein n=1 Tax=Nocardia sp. AB354 TaxID=3413283 RepID=UPI003C22D765
MNLDELLRNDDGGPRIVRIDDVPALDYLDAAARRVLWGRRGVLPVLEKFSRLLADLDLSSMDNSDDDVALAFLSAVSEPARSEAAAQLARGNAVLHPLPLLLAIKEVIEHADSDEESELSCDELLAVLLSIASEAHEAAMPARGGGFDQTLGEITVNRIAQALLLFPEPLEMLLTTTQGTWYRSWSDRTSKKTRRDLAAGPAEQWAEITGVALDDFLSLGWLFYNLWRHEGFSRINASFFSDHSVAPEAVKFLIEHCSLTVSDLRSLLRQERAEGAALWTRYKLQQFPFVRLDDGTLVPIRFQFVIQRIFGDHLYLESEAILRQRDSKKADHYAESMRDIFEERVGEVLQRICAYDASGNTVLIQEDQMRRAWRTSKSSIPKICDFALFRDHGCVLVDANMRNLPQPFAEGSGTFDSLQQEIEQRFTATKFKQLLSTVDLFMTRSWNRLHTAVTGRTRFVPLVVVPDAGMPSELATENAIFVKGVKLVQKYNDNLNFYRVHAPAILCWRDLLILDGLAEKGVDIFALLKRWRNIDPRGRSGRQPIPIPLGEYVDQCYPGSSMGRQERKRGWDLFEGLRDHTAQRAIDSAPPSVRDSLARSIAGQRRQLPTWENRGEFEMQSGRAVRIRY